MEATWAVHAAGTTLLHAGLRADNMLMTGDGVVIAGWPHACRGAAFADMVLLAPSVAMQGGPEPADLPARSPAGRSASPAGVTATVCALAGYFTERSLRPPPTGGVGRPPAKQLVAGFLQAGYAQQGIARRRRSQAGHAKA